MNYTIIDGQSAAANITTNGMDTDRMPVKPRTLGVQFVTDANFNGTTSTIKVQHSNIDEDAYYKDIDNVPTITLSAGANNQIQTPFVDVGMAYYRIVYAKGDATLGELTVVANFN